MDRDRIQDPDLLAVEDVLRSSSPEPDNRFVRDLERSLPIPSERRLPRPRPVVAVAAVAGAIAAVAFGFSLADVGPLALDGDDSSGAQEDCRMVRVTRSESVPRVVIEPDGTPRVTRHRQPVERLVKRCR